MSPVAAKKGKSQILDHVVEITGWNRDHARQQLGGPVETGPGDGTTATVAVIDRRKTKACKYSTTPG